MSDDSFVRTDENGRVVVRMVHKPDLRPICPTCHGLGGMPGSYSSSFGYDEHGNYVSESSHVRCFRCNRTGRIEVASTGAQQKGE